MSTQIGRLFTRSAAVVAAVAGLSAAAIPAAGADCPVRLYAAPTHGLSANATVNAVVTGLTPGGTYYFGECGWVPTGCAGNPANVVQFTADEHGNTVTKIVAQKVYVGNIGDGVNVTVDCAAVQCTLGIYTPTVEPLVRVDIRFR